MSNVRSGMGIGTKILMYDGTFKKVEDLTIGDVLMGDDSTPRNIVDVYSGNTEMYEFTPVKGNKFIISGEQIISLVRSYKPGIFWYKNENRYKVIYYCGIANAEKRQIFSLVRYNSKEAAYLAASEFMKTLSQDEFFIDNTINYCISKFQKKSKWVYYRSGVNFSLNNNVLLIDPYYLGLWLGDGMAMYPTTITNIDPEVINYIYLYAEKLGLNVSNNKENYRIIGNKRKGENCLLNYFKY